MRLTLPDEQPNRILRWGSWERSAILLERSGRSQTRTKNKVPASPFLKPPPFRIRLDMSDHAGRQKQAQTGVTAGQLTWDFCGQRHRARRNMMCTDNLQCSCRIEHQWRSGGLWLDTAKYEIFTKVHLTKARRREQKPDGKAGKDEAPPPFESQHVQSRGCECASDVPSNGKLCNV